MTDYDAMEAGYDFAATFQRAYIAAMRDHENLRLYQQDILNRSTIFLLASDEAEMLIDTKLRTNTVRYDRFGINVDEWNTWQQADGLHLPFAQIVIRAAGEVDIRQRILRPVPRVAILGCASDRPVEQCLIAQWVDRIRAQIGPRYADTLLESYTTLSAVLQEGIGIEPELADQIQQQVLADPFHAR